MARRLQNFPVSTTSENKRFLCYDTTLPNNTATQILPVELLLQGGGGGNVKDTLVYDGREADSFTLNAEHDENQQWVIEVNGEIDVRGASNQVSCTLVSEDTYNRIAVNVTTTSMAIYMTSRLKTMVNMSVFQDDGPQGEYRDYTFSFNAIFEGEDASDASFNLRSIRIWTRRRI